jgi:type I restriction enzyme, S subunit
VSVRYAPECIGDVLKLERRIIEIDPMATYELIGVYSFGKGIFHRAPMLGSDLGAYRFSLIKNGDLVLSNIQAWEGAIALAGPQDAGCIGTHRFLTYVPIDERADTNYLRYFFLSERGMDLIRKASPGSIVRNRTLGIKAFESLKIPLPSIAAQRKIAAHVGKLLSRTRLVNELIAQRSPSSLLSILPGLTQEIFESDSVDRQPVAALADFVTDTVHPGDDPGDADVFVGLQHIESHSGRRLGSVPLGDEKGRKFSFEPGDVVYGYLRPYLNKVWVADRHGLCSVDQYVLRPKRNVHPGLLAHALRSRSTLDEAIRLTHSLQLPRLRSSLLSAIEVPAVARQPASIESGLDNMVKQVSELADLRGWQLKIVAALETAALNEAFANLT